MRLPSLLISLMLWSHSALFSAIFTVTNNLDTGAGSLRDAISQANGSAGADVIEFNIPGAGVHTITLASALPVISEELFIDGSTEPGYAGQPLIEVNGNGVIANILHIGATAPNTHISALIVNNSLTNGILINGANSKITACYIGTNSAGTAAVANVVSGIDIRANGTLIGGDAAGEGNLISGNTDFGIFGFFNIDSITVQGNLIGTDVTGTNAIPNGAGVYVWGDELELGGIALAGRNIISGNNTGVTVFGDKVIAKNNYVGTNINGDMALPNVAEGMILNGDSNLIGGLLASEANVISGNGTYGISVSGSAGSRIFGNFIGTDYMGTTAIPNSQVGIILNTITGTTIGSTNSAERNIISGNGQGGIRFNSGSQNYTYGNYIGTDITGTVAMGNQGIGIAFNSSGKNFIGDGTTAGANVISGNTSMGISLNGANADSNEVKLNYIGTDPSGFVNLANGGAGVYVNGGGEDNEIGSLIPGEGNIIANNLQGGVLVNFSGSIRNRILGNSIYDHPLNGIRLTTGGNNNQAAPGLTGYANGPGTTTVFGTFLSAPNTSYRLEFYTSPTNNQGKTFVGTTNIITDGTGFYALAEVLAFTLTAAEPIITATATDPDGNTSEFGVSTVLETDFLDFSVHQMPDLNARLVWEIPHTDEGRYFEIEHGQEQMVFTKLGEQHSFKLDQDKRIYLWDTKSLAPGMHFFRLRSKNANGDIGYSTILQFENKLEKAIRLNLRNPVQGIQTLTIGLNKAQAIEVSLYNLAGQKIDQIFYGAIPANTNWEISINAKKYSSGIYLLEVKGSFARTLKKIMIEQ